MELLICSPLDTVVQTKIEKVTFEAVDGYRTLLPKHVDFVSALGAGIITYVPLKGTAKYVACHQGIVVKQGDKVTISAQGTVTGDTLTELQEHIQHDYKQNEEHRKELSAAMARLELGLARGFQQLKGGTYD